MRQSVTLQLPEERNELMELQANGKSAICLVNRALIEFEHKAVFGWYFSLTLDLQQCDERGFPDEHEKALLNEFFDRLDPLMKDSANALFLARITWSGTQELLWRVHDPKVADDLIKTIIEDQSHPRPFDYRIMPDDDWKLSDWLLDPMRK